MRNVAPSRSLVRRANALKTLAFFVGAVGAFVTAISTLLFVITLVPASGSVYGIYNFLRGLALVVGIAMLIGAVVMAIRAFTWKTDNDLAQTVAGELSRLLDDRFTLIRNVSKSEIGYIDAVLLGPPGALVFRLVDAVGVYANEGLNWMTLQADGSYAPARIKPSQECLDDMMKLSAYFVKHGIELPVNGVVVFMDKKRVELRAGDPAVPITRLDMLNPNLSATYLQEQPQSQQAIVSAIHLLYSE